MKAFVLEIIPLVIWRLIGYYVIFYYYDSDTSNYVTHLPVELISYYSFFLFSTYIYACEL